MMQKVLNGNVTLDIDSMSLEELTEARDKLRDGLSKVNVDDEHLANLRQVLFTANHQIFHLALFSRSRSIFFLYIYKREQQKTTMILAILFRLPRAALLCSLAATAKPPLQSPVSSVLFFSFCSW